MQVAYVLPSKPGVPIRKEDGSRTSCAMLLVAPVNRGRQLLEAEVNNQRMYCTSSRCYVECYFARHYRFQCLGNSEAVYPSMLDPCGYPGTPQVMKITSLHINAAAINATHGKGFYLSHKLRPGVTYAVEAKHLIEINLTIIWLDAHRQIRPLFCFNLQRAPTEVLIVQDQLIGVNIMQAEETEFPDVSDGFPQLFNELATGSYLPKCARKLLLILGEMS